MDPSQQVRVKKADRVRLVKMAAGDRAAPGAACRAGQAPEKT